jgi:hypothetical protein
MRVNTKSVIAVAISLSISSAQAQDKPGFFGYKAGVADALVTGSASTGGATDAAPSLEKCEIDNQSKLQIEKLNKSFHLLFKESSKFNTNDKSNVKFGCSIKVGDINFKLG